MFGVEKVVTKVHSLWLRAIYPFHLFGKGVSIHYTCEIRRVAARWISLGNDVALAKDVWLNVPENGGDAGPVIVLGDGCKLGRRSVISAKRSIRIGENVLLAPAVLMMDHNHEFVNPHEPISMQGTTLGGRIVVEKNCWIGYGAVILCDSGDLTIGEHSVVGANAVVRKSVPPYSVIVGNPARLVKQYDPTSGQWHRLSEAAQR